MPVSYNHSLVLVSLAVAILASYVALNLVANMSVARGRSASLVWLVGSAVAMGTGIWSMHFIGMLAASIGIQMTYQLGWTALSLLIAVLISGFALNMISSEMVSQRKLLFCGTVMGAGIASMHYVGMGALQVSPAVRYEPLLFALSVLIAMAASYVALWLFVKMRAENLTSPLLKRGASAVVMGIAIVGMHYTGMAAAGFSPDSICTAPSETNNAGLALTIAALTVMLLGAALLSSMFDAHLTLRSAEHENNLTQVNELLRREKVELAQANELLRTEIVERAAAEVASRQADAANNAKSSFLATMSHEIRTPMHGLLGMLEMLSLTPLDRSQQASIRVIRESGHSLMRIIDDILDFSKIEAHKLDILPEPVSIRQLVDSVRSAFDANASGKGLLLQTEIDPRISPALSVDPLRLRQILNNLVSNAIKFTSHGKVTITVDLVERTNGADRLRFCVQDSGIGIAPEDQRHLFSPFAQADGKTSRNYGGTGLGLAICQRLAHLMGGSVGMRSVLGEGTAMTLELALPVVADGLAQAPNLVQADRSFARPARNREIDRPNAASPPKDASGALVLIVDDDEVNRMLLVSQLEVLGYSAQSATNGVEALAMWKTGGFSLVLTDCQMPQMNGYELAVAIRAIEADGASGRCPIVACTANATKDEAATCSAAGMDDYLVKPMDLNALHAKISRWLPPGAA